MVTSIVLLPIVKESKWGVRLPCLSQGENGEDYLHRGKAASFFPCNSPQRIASTVFIIVYPIISLCVSYHDVAVEYTLVLAWWAWPQCLCKFQRFKRPIIICIQFWSIEKGKKGQSHQMESSNHVVLLVHLIQFIQLTRMNLLLTADWCYALSLGQRRVVLLPMKRHF